MAEKFNGKATFHVVELPPINWQFNREGKTDMEKLNLSFPADAKEFINTLVAMSQSTAKRDGVYVLLAYLTLILLYMKAEKAKESVKEDIGDNINLLLLSLTSAMLEVIIFSDLDMLERINLTARILKRFIPVATAVKAILTFLPQIAPLKQEKQSNTEQVKNYWLN